MTNSCFCLIDTKAADFVEGLVKDAQEKGAKEVIAFKRDGNLISPVLFDNITPEMRLAWEEPFGPVLPVIRVKSLEEAIDLCSRVYSTNEYV